MLHVIYLDLPSAIGPVPQNIEVLIPIKLGNLDISQEDDNKYKEINTSASLLSSNSELKKPRSLN